MKSPKVLSRTEFLEQSYTALEAFGELDSLLEYDSPERGRWVLLSAQELLTTAWAYMHDYSRDPKAEKLSLKVCEEWLTLFQKVRRKDPPQ